MRKPHTASIDAHSALLHRAPGHESLSRHVMKELCIHIYHRKEFIYSAGALDYLSQGKTQASQRALLKTLKLLADAMATLLGLYKH